MSVIGTRLKKRAEHRDAARKACDLLVAGLLDLLERIPEPLHQSVLTMLQTELQMAMRKDKEDEP
jgi:hypothetical protein